MIPANEIVEFAMLLSGLARSATSALPRPSTIEMESLALLASPSNETRATSENTFPLLAVWKPSNWKMSSSMMASWAIPLRIRM